MRATPPPRHRHSQSARRSSRRTVRLRPLPAAIGALLIAALLGATNFAYTNDDVYQFGVQRADGFGSTYLRLNVWGHFAPFNRTIHAIIEKLSPFSWLLGLTLAIALLAVCLAVFNAWMCELRIGEVRRSVALVLLALTACAHDTVTRADSAFHVLPATIVILVVLTCTARALRTTNRYWGLAACGVLALGFLTQERVAVAAVLAPCALVMVNLREEPLKQRLGQLRSHLRWLLPLIGVAAIGGAYDATKYVNPFTSQQAHIHPLFGIEVLGEVVAGRLLPNLFGAWPGSAPSLVWAVVEMAIIVAFTVAVIRWKRSNAWLVLFGVVTLCAFYLPLATSPLQVATVLFSVNTPEYLFYALGPLLAAAACLPPLLPGVRHRLHFDGDAGPRTIRLATLGIIGAVVVLVIVEVVSPLAGFDPWFSSWTPSHRFVDGLTSDTGQWSTSRQAVVPLHVPSALADDWAADLGDEEHLLPLLQRGFVMQPVDSATAVLINPTGQIRQALFVPTAPAVVPVATPPGEATASTSSLGACVTGPPGAPPTLGLSGTVGAGGTPTIGSPSLIINLTSTIQGRPATETSGSAYVLQLNYHAASTLEVLVVSVIPPGWPAPAHSVHTGGQTLLANDWPITLPSGTHRMMLPIDTTTFSGLQLSGISAGATVCATSATVGQLAVATSTHTCSIVDRYGAPTTSVPCITATRP